MRGMYMHPYNAGHFSTHNYALALPVEYKKLVYCTEK